LPQATVRLLWNAKSKKQVDGTKSTQIELIVTDGANFTGTEILSDQVAQIAYAGKPVELPFYGLTIGIAGLTADGQLNYSVSPIASDTTIGFVFRGYVLRIMMI